MYKILCVGPQWRGSNAGGLFNALKKIGNIISIVDEFYHIPLVPNTLTEKFINKVTRRFNIDGYNKSIINESNKLNPDFVLIYKGAFVFPKTIKKLKENFKVINFYPDVSFFTHGKYLPKCLPLYDHIFSTKSFAINDLKRHYNYSNVTFIPHGFDKDIHRPINLKETGHTEFDCEASFIGTYTKKKHNILNTVCVDYPEIDLKIWGGQWDKSNDSLLKKYIQWNAVLGDLYAMAINASKINIAILSEKVKGASSGDMITSRTFHIPGAGGFMIHERTDEVLEYFDEDKEIVCFSEPIELLDKIKYYLAHDSLRENIRIKGYEKAHKFYSLNERAKFLVKKMENIGILKKTNN